MKWIVVGVILLLGAGFAGFMVYANAGTVALGGKCSLTSDCTEGTCEYVSGSNATHDLTSRCVVPCQGDKCPPSLHCRTVVETGSGAEKTRSYCLP